MAEMVTHPHPWTTEEMGPWKAWWKENLKQGVADPRVASHQRAIEDLLGDHPSAKGLTPEAVETLTPEEFSRLTQGHFAPDNAVLVIAGNVDPELVRKLVSPLFEPWRTSGLPSEKGPQAAALPQKSISLMDRPGSEQNFIRLSAIGVDAGSQSSPDFFPLIVASQVLGGGFSSRLFQILRQSLGYAYNAFSSVITDPAVALWTFGLYTRPEKTEPALLALLEQARRMREEQPSDLELGSAKNALIGGFLMSLDQIGNIADRLLGLDLFGLPLEDWGLYPVKISQVTGEAIRRISGKLLDPERLAVTVVGEAPAVRRALSEIRPVREFDREGRPNDAVEVERESPLGLAALSARPVSGR